LIINYDVSTSVFSIYAVLESFILIKPVMSLMTSFAAVKLLLMHVQLIENSTAFFLN
jgi:hypothetical protein